MENQQNTNDRAVSPVIGVLLMCSITVILAAIIAAFVFGMSGNIEKPHNAVVTAQKISSSLASATLQKGDDVAGLIFDLNGQKIYVGNTSAPLGDQPLNVGETFSIALGNRPAGQTKDHLVVTCIYVDESKGVVLDTFL